MKDKKHIDRLFQEKLKDFEATPNDSVWKNISSELHLVNKGRKGIPVWWRVAGFLLLFTLGQLILNDDADSPIENIVDVDSANDLINNEEKVSSNDDINNVVEENNVSENSNPESSTPLNNSLTNKNQKQITVSNDKDNLNIVTTASVKNRNTNRSSFNTEKNEIVTASVQTKSKITEPNNSSSPR